MTHFDGTAEARSVSDIMAAARDLQDRHAPRVIGTMVHRLREAGARLVSGRSRSGGRSLVAG